MIGRKYYYDRDLSSNDIQKLRNFIVYIKKNVSLKNTITSIAPTKSSISSNFNQKRDTKKPISNYTTIESVSKFNVLLSKNKGKKIKMRLKLFQIINTNTAVFQDQSIGAIIIDYNKCNDKSLEILANLKMGEFCTIKGIASEAYGQPKIIAEIIEK